MAEVHKRNVASGKVGENWNIKMVSLGLKFASNFKICVAIHQISVKVCDDDRPPPHDIGDMFLGSHVAANMFWNSVDKKLLNTKTI